MTRISTILFLGILGAFSAGCGPSATPADPKAPVTEGAQPMSTGTPATSTCTTPEGATKENPGCADGCAWDEGTSKCIDGTRGVTVDQKDNHGKGKGGN